mmetsp:Transcript_6617/g.10457  ORF Transcript_6617/g.10457 Transcript_6617/m.10457 type:complete len:346 (-) Transcript_6617:407-1444(-)
MPGELRNNKGGRVSPFQTGAQQMMSLDLDNVTKGNGPSASPKAKSPTHMRSPTDMRALAAPHLARPALTEVYSPSPAPFITVDNVKKSALRPPGTPGTGQRVTMPENVEQSFVSENQPDPTVAKVLNENVWETPRAKWRKQYWNKSTPWATDRRVYAGHGIYRTTVKPHSRNYNASGRWELESTINMSKNSEDIVRQIVQKLEQHCSSTFALTRAFKIFDRDMSSTIDSEEMRAVLVTFSIDLTDDQMISVMHDFGAEDYQDGKGLQIKYTSFVNAVDRLASKHPLEMTTGRFIRDLRANYTRDDEGRRLCTPGFKAPVGCPIAGCYFPEVEPEWFRTPSDASSA